MEFPHAIDLLSDFHIMRRYVLAYLFEAAKYLSAEDGTNLVAKICQAASMTLFCARTSRQDGTGRINEAPSDTWRQQFAHHRYHPLNVVRWRVWGRSEVKWCYQRNIVAYADASFLAACQDLRTVRDAIRLNAVRLIVALVNLNKSKQPQYTSREQLSSFLLLFSRRHDAALALDGKPS